MNKEIKYFFWDVFIGGRIRKMDYLMKRSPCSDLFLCKNEIPKVAENLPSAMWLISYQSVILKE